MVEILLKQSEYRCGRTPHVHLLDADRDKVVVVGGKISPRDRIDCNRERGRNARTVPSRNLPDEDRYLRVFSLPFPPFPSLPLHYRTVPLPSLQKNNANAGAGNASPPIVYLAGGITAPSDGDVDALMKFVRDTYIHKFGRRPDSDELIAYLHEYEAHLAG